MNIEENNIALFIDTENFIRSAMEIALPVDLAPIVNKLLEHGRLSIRRGFGDLDAACKGDWNLRMSMRRMIQENLVQFEDIPYLTKYKNTADMRLAVDALSVAYSNADINYFAIVASDRDYVPVIAKLKELGKRIIGIGMSQDTVHEIYVKSCDVFIYYSSLFQTEAKVEHVMAEQGDPRLLDTYLQLLVQATSALAAKGTKAVGGQLVPLMRQLRPDFDLKLVNLTSFRDLVDLAEQRKLVTVKPSGGDLLLQLGNTADIVETPRMPQSFDISDHAGAKALYRGFLEDKMKCALPSCDVRARIYDTTYRLIESHKLLGGPKNLVDISAEVWKKMGAEGSGLVQSMIFKVLYSIYRGDAFEAEVTEMPYNPKIKTGKVPVDEWDRLFIRNSLIVMSRERRTWPLMEDPLAELFEVEPSVIVRELAEIQE